MSRAAVARPRQARAGIVETLRVGASALGQATLALGPVLLVAGLALYNLEYYPRTWFDEGINLVAARTLAESGRYGIEHADGFQAFDVSISTGPTVIGPVALAFTVAGTGLAQARVVAVLYLLLAALGLYRVGAQLYGRAVGALAVVVFASITQLGPFAHGRHVLGELAALAFLFWGASLFIRARATNGSLTHAAAGLLLGLAVLSKNQLVLLAPIVALTWLVGRSWTGFSFRQLGLMLIALVAPLTLWYAYQFLTLGPAGFLGHLAGLSEVASFSSYVSPLARLLGALNVLVSSGFGALMAAGLIYVWLLALRDREERRPERLLLPAFATFWLAWYLGFSMGYARYAAPVAITSSLFVARLFNDLARAYVLTRGSSGGPLRTLAANPLGAGLGAVMALSICSGIAQNGLAIVRARDDSPQRFAELVERYVPPNAVVEASDWEIKFLTDRSYHHPPATLINEGVAVVFLGRPPESVQWYQVPSSATYLVDGPFSRLTGIYRVALEGGAFQRIASYGEYDLYQRR